MCVLSKVVVASLGLFLPVPSLVDVLSMLEVMVAVVVRCQEEVCFSSP